MFKNLLEDLVDRIFNRRPPPPAQQPPRKPVTLESQIASGMVYLEREFTDISELPSNMKVDELDISRTTKLKHLPAGLACESLVGRSCSLVSVPADISVKYRLDLNGSTALVELPEGLTVDYLLLRNCTGLEKLPEGIDVWWLDVSGCLSLREWPPLARVKGRFVARGCAQFTQLPPWLKRVSELDVSGWRDLSSLPEDLVVTASLDIGNTAITSLPEGCREAKLRWRGVLIDERIAFHPETIEVKEVLAERNVERRRVLLERLGYERFVAEANVKIVDRDTDTRGGSRRLLRVPMPNDEDLVCVEVTCPSTDRKYMLRVPPRTNSCRQAVAWVCGFDDAKDYKPLQET